MAFKHHIIPRHAGGTDDSSNIKEVSSFEEHAEEHRLLFERYGRREDWLAWKSLSSQIGKEEIMLERARLGGSKGKENPKKMGANNSFFGAKHSKDTKELIGKQSSDRNKGRAPWNKGISGVFHHTVESKEAIRKSKLNKKRIGFIPWNKGKKFIS